MTYASRLIVILALLLASVAVIPAMAQNTSTVTLTESQINSSWRVTGTNRLRVSNLVVDLQPGQAVVSATLTPRRGGSYAGQMTVSPTVTNGKVTWTLVSATVDGKTATSDQISQVSSALLDSWQAYIKTDIGQRTVTAVTITADDITYTLTGSAPGGTVVVNNGAASVTLTEATINSSWRIRSSRTVQVSNFAVDLQPNQAVLTATLTPRNGTAYSAQMIVTPTVSNGKVTWTFLSATINGQAATSDQLSQINTAVINSWNEYVGSQIAKKTVTAVTITDTDITYTITK